jgi:hypothetical protein
VVIPGNDGAGNLPPGVHSASLEQIRRRFATNHRRREIFEGLEWVVGELLGRGVQEIWINGSFVTSKVRPRDVDVIFSPTVGYGHGWGILHISSRDALKLQRRVDLLTSSSGQPDLVTGLLVPILDFFQRDRNGRRKGILKLTVGQGSI